MADVGFAIFVAAHCDGCPEALFRLAGISQREISHSQLIVGFVIARRERDGLLEIVQSSCGIFVLVEFFLAGLHQIAGFGVHGEFMGGDGAGFGRILGLGASLQVDGNIFL
jgi:hypothetical protein